MIDATRLVQSLTCVDLTCGLDDGQALDHARANRQLKRIGLNNELILAAIWADNHPAESIDPHQLDLPGGNRPIRPGGDGTPELARFCVSEYAVESHLGTGTAEHLIADALDLQHRLPQLDARMRSYQIDARDCQTIARETRHLTLAQARMVDAEIAPVVGNVTFYRLMILLAAAIINADPDRVKREAEKIATSLGAWLGEANGHGIKALYMRLKAADALWLYASLKQMVGVLQRRGITGSKGELFSAAARVLAIPLLAVQYLAEDTEPTLFDDDTDYPGPANDGPLLARPDGPDLDCPDLAEPSDDEWAAGQDDERSACQDDEQLADPADDHGDDSQSPEAGIPTGTRNLGTANMAHPTDCSGHRDETEPADAAQPPDPDTAASSLPPEPAEEDEIPADPAQANDQSGFRIEQDRRLAEQAIRAISAIDPAKLLPDATLYVHIALETLQSGLGVTRVEDLGPIVSSLVADWLDNCHISLKPVIDLNSDLMPVDAYETPQRMRERIFLKHPTSMFPYSNITDRTRLDLDHNIPYTPGIGGQTREDRLSPAGRREHNVITHGPGWSRRRPTPGTILFRAPHGSIFLVNQTGSHDLGRDQFAQYIFPPRIRSTTCHAGVVAAAGPRVSIAAGRAGRTAAAPKIHAA